MTIKEINNIPTDNLQRLFKVKVKSVLNKEKEGRLSINGYVKGIGIFAEISLKLGQQVMAVQYIESSIKFLSSFAEDELARIEGWNETQDRFWIDTVSSYIDKLLDWKQYAENYYIIPIKED